MTKIDPGITDDIAWLASRPPAAWASKTAANGVWREVRGCLIPKPDNTWRPVAIPHVFRRIWASAVTAELLPHAARYCEPRGQLGLSADGGATAYAAVARACLALGGTVCTDDRVNSFGEIDRSAVMDAAVDFVNSAPDDVAAIVRGRLGALLHRVHFGPIEDGAWNSRTTHIYTRSTDLYSHKNHGLVQGSPESSLVEAIVYSPTSTASDGVKQHGARPEQSGYCFMTTASPR